MPSRNFHTNKKSLVQLLGFSFILFATPAVSNESIVVQHGNTVVTVDDLRRSIEAMVPPSQVAGFMASESRLKRHAGNYFVVRKLAEMAEGRALTADEAWRVEEARARALSQVEIDRVVAQAQQPDFGQLAQEIYQANPERFKADETVRVSHVLVSTKDRSEDEARGRAEMALKAAREGRDFAQIVSEYSDDPSAKVNGGDLGFFGRNQMVKPFEDAAFSLTKAGELSGVVQSQFGFHVIRFVERRPAGLRPFDEVKQSIIAGEQDKFRTKIVNQLIDQVGSLEGVDINYANLMTLHKPLSAFGPRAAEQPQ